MGRTTEVPGPKESEGSSSRQQDAARLRAHGGVDRSHAFSDLALEEQLYRTLVEQIPAITYISEYGPQGRWHYVSPKIETLLGFSPQDWLANAELWLEHVHPEDRARVLAAEEEARRTGHPMRCEYRLQRRDGSYRWFRDEAVTLSSRGDGPALLHGVLYDIHESKAAEETLRESAERLRLALEASGMGAFEMDARTGSLHWDLRGGELFQLPERLCGRPFTDLLFRVHPEDRETLRATVEHAAVSGDPFHLEFRVVLDDSGVEWRSVYGCAIRDANGAIVRLVGIGEGISERKRAEEALRRSEERYRALYEDNVAGLLVATQDGNLLDCNQALVRMHGYDAKAELQAVTMDQLDADPQDRKKLLQHLRANGQVNNFEARHVRKDGSVIWVLRSARLVANPEGGPQLIFGTAVDITKRKNAEAALKQSEERLRESQDQLRHTLNHAPLVLFSLDTEGHFLLSEGQGLQALGLRPGQVVGQSIKELYKDYPDILANFRRAISGEEFAAVNRISFDSRVLTYETAWTPLRSGDGTIVGAAGVATNITEREQAETALRDSEERLRLAVHAADMGVWEWDAATDRSTWDAGLHRIMGVPSDEFDGRTETLARLIHPEDREKFLTSIEQAARMGELYQLDFRVVRPDGRMAWIADRGRPEFDPSGKLLRFRGVARDVTKQRELSEQLERAQKMEAIGQLAGGIAHDFNNLLMVIRGNMELVREKAAGNPGSERTISAVLQAADRAAAITRQLLAFSRRQVLQPKIVELGSIVSETAGLLRRVIGPAIQLELQMPADPLYARVDASQLDQVVVNLVINARDAMPEGGRVTLRVDRAAAESESVRRVRFPQMPEADYVRLTVSDIGTGMDAATQAHIFEPFFTTKELGKGTGLGLATVYGIVKQSDGWIWVDSEPGKGASFEVYLPEVAAPQQAEAPPRARSSELRGTETLVVVDDEEDILELATGYLSSLGYQVIAASSGDQALEKIGAHAGPIDALITDAQMPGTPGLRLAQTVRATRPDIKVLYISGYAEDSGIPGRLPRADEDFLQKPFELSELATKIRELLRK